MIFLGEDEVAAGAASIKEMATGQQQSVPFDQVPAYLLQRVAPMAQGKPIQENNDD